MLCCWLILLIYVAFQLIGAIDALLKSINLTMKLA